MCKKLIFLVSLVAILGLVGSAHGLNTIYWDAGGTDNLWDTGANWKSYDTSLHPDNTAPDGGDDSRVAVAGDSTGSDIALIDSTVAATALRIGIGSAFVDSPEGSPIGPGVLTMTGGTLTGEKMFIGQSDIAAWAARDPSYFNMSGGTVTLSGVMVVGRVSPGILNMTGGVLSAVGIIFERYVEAAGSTLTLDGALITNSGALDFRTGGLLDIKNYGVMKLLGMDDVIAVNRLILAGNITGDGIGSGAYTSFDGTDTIIIPEPATMMLLGLGGLFLVRRKR